MPSEPQLNHLLIIEDDKGRREFVLDAPTYSIGRDAKCDVRLVSQFVSRRHATLHQMPGANRHANAAASEGEPTEDITNGLLFYYRIVDGDGKAKPSANGLLINGRKLQVHNLQNGDEIIFGPGVRAIYYLLKRDPVVTIPPDEFDITLISPNMIGEPEDDQMDTSDRSGKSYSSGLDELDFSDQDITDFSLSPLDSDSSGPPGLSELID